MFKNKINQRIVFALIFLCIFIPAIISAVFLGQEGRIVGFVVFNLVSIWGLFEIFVSLKFTKTTAILASLVVPFFSILPVHNLRDIIISASSNVYTFIWFAWLKKAFLSWEPWLALLIFSLAAILAEVPKLSWKQFFQKWLLTFFLMFVVSTFTKMGWFTVMTYFWTFIFLVLIAVISDTCGYFGGLLFGKKWFFGAKLAPKISPNKTWAGSFVAFMSSILFALPFGYFVGIWSGLNNPLLIAVSASFLLSFSAQIGDLFFSWVKRRQKIKDFSKLIPGHGGIFDRLDAMCFVFVFALWLFLVNIIY